MGPTNVALVNLYKADMSLRDAQGRLDGASKSVRVQERKIADLVEKQKLAQSKLREAQSAAGQLELDIKSRTAKIERLRTQQQTAKTNKEYQTFLSEINTEKTDRDKVEEAAFKALQAAETIQKELAELHAQIDTERQKHEQNKLQLAGRLGELKGEVDKLKPERDEAAALVPAKALEMFERMVDRLDGEAMAALGKPDRRREEYVCHACNMDLVADVYNKLRTRDEVVICPNCRRILYIPADLTPEHAINTPKARKEIRGKKNIAAAVGRQMSAADIARSIMPDEEDEPESAPAADAAEAAAEAAPDDDDAADDGPPPAAPAPEPATAAQDQQPATPEP